MHAISNLSASYLVASIIILDVLEVPVAFELLLYRDDAVESPAPTFRHVHLLDPGEGNAAEDFKLDRNALQLAVFMGGFADISGKEDGVVRVRWKQCGRRGRSRGPRQRVKVHSAFCSCEA